jgi:AcrR family transcriptional regulator
MTARARIRNAALQRFASDGINGVSVRLIAADAGVSPALVIHHFGSKEGLRAECDAYVVEMVRDKDLSALLGHRPADPRQLAAAYEESTLALRYLARALTDGSTAAADLFDHLVAETDRLMTLGEQAGSVAPSANPRARAAVLVSMQLGGLVLHEHLSRALGVDTLTPVGAVRVGRMALELFSGLFTEDTYSAALAALDPTAATLDPTAKPARKEKEDT